MAAPVQINIAIAYTSPTTDYIRIGLVAQAIADAIGGPLQGQETPLLQRGLGLVSAELSVHSRFKSVPDARLASRVIRAAIEQIQPEASVVVRVVR